MVLFCSKKTISIIKGNNKHNSDFYWLNCLPSFATENKHKSHKIIFENKDFCNIVMPSENTKILEFNQYQKFDKALFIFYADLECLKEKIYESKKNPEK